MEALDLARAAADPDRLAVLGAVAHEPLTAEAVATRTGLADRQVLEILGTLRQQGLVTVAEQGYVLDRERLREAATSLPQEQPADERIGYGMTSDERRILARFFRGQTLVELPATRSKRLVVLERLALEFEPGTRYSEREVNATLQRFDADVAVLRRALVDEGFLDRAEGEYWRAGGRVDV